MAERKTITKPAAPRKEPAADPWWHGLSQATADELRRRGYQSKDDAMLLAGRLHYHGQSKRARQRAHDPFFLNRPWLSPRMIPMSIVNEVREWLGADPV